MGVVGVVGSAGFLLRANGTPHPLARLASLARAVIPVVCGVEEPEEPSTLGIAMLERLLVLAKGELRGV